MGEYNLMLKSPVTCGEGKAGGTTSMRKIVALLVSFAFVFIVPAVPQQQNDQDFWFT